MEPRNGILKKQASVSAFLLEMDACFNSKNVTRPIEKQCKCRKGRQCHGTAGLFQEFVYMLSGTVIFIMVSALRMTVLVAVHRARRAWHTAGSASFTRQEL